MNRRSFLKRASGLVAAVAAPLFIPAANLDFGVPRRIVVPEPPEMLKIIGGEVGSVGPIYLGHERTISFDMVIAGNTPTSTFTFQASADGQSWTDLGAGPTFTTPPDKPYVRAVWTVPSTYTYRPVLRLPAGEFRFSESLAISSNTHIVGAGIDKTILTFDDGVA